MRASLGPASANLMNIISETERYWRSFELLYQLNLPAPADVLEIDAGYMRG
jgi:hypothetical protein